MVDCVGMVLQGCRVAMRVGSQRCADRGLKNHSGWEASYGRGCIVAVRGEYLAVVWAQEKRFSKLGSRAGNIIRVCASDW